MPSLLQNKDKSNQSYHYQAFFSDTKFKWFLPTDGSLGALGSYSIGQTY